MEAWNKGLKTGKLSEKHRLKISNTMKGKKPKNFDEMLKKGIEFQKLNHGNSGTWKVGHKRFDNSYSWEKGHKPWNVGKEGYKVNITDEERLRRKKYLLGNQLRSGTIGWNKNLTPRRGKYDCPMININGKKILLSHYVWCKANQIHRIPDGCVVHHLDFDINNNKPENLQLLENAYHTSMHMKILKLIKTGEIII
jgi:hypothetical protein